jgi:Mrp family chromosome partitioning ATPase
VALVSVALVVAAASEILPRVRRPIYRAEATFLISPVFARNLTEDRELQVPNFQQFIQQQVVTLGQVDTARGALDRLGAKRGLWLQAGESPQQAAARLQAALLAARVADTSYVVVGLEDERPEGLADIVNAVAEAYLARVKAQPFFDLETRVGTLTRRKAELLEQIRGQTEQIDRWAKELGTPDFESSVHQEGRLEMERVLNAARSRRLDAEARLAALKARHESLQGADVGPEAVNQLGADVELNGLRTVLLARKSELRSKILPLTREHAGRTAIEQEMAEIDAELARAEASALKRIRAVLEQRRRDQIQEERRTLEAEVEQAKRYEATVAAEASALSQRVGLYAQRALEAKAVRQAMERLGRQVDAISDRLDSIRLESTAPGFVHLVSSADTPVKPARRGGLKWVLAFGLAAVGMAFAGPLALDLAVRRVRTPADVERAVDAPVLGWVPERRRRTEPLVREQIRRLALALDRERRDNRRRCFTFTSIAPGAGSTHLVVALARELGAIRVRAIAVEANALRPDAAFGTAESPGLIEALQGRVPVESVVLPADEQLPDRIPWGRAWKRALPVSAETLKTFWERFHGRYDMILVDAPPLPLSSDAELLVSVADASLLVVRSEKDSVAEVKRAFQFLHRTAPHAVGILLNRVRLPRFGSDAGRV